MEKPRVGTYWTHTKTRTSYRIIAVGLWEETLEECVVYVSENGENVGSDLWKSSWMGDSLSDLIINRR